MRKKRMICLLCGLLALCLLAGCTPSGVPDTDSGTGTTPAAAPTGVTTEAPTEMPTEAPTEAETEPPFIPTTYEEHKAEIYRKVNNTVTLGGFLTPVGKQNVEPAFIKLKEAGINLMVTQNEFYGTALLANTLRVADQVGMDLNIWLIGPHVIDAKTATDKLKQCLGHPSVKYLYLQDEPMLESVPGLKDETNRIRKAYGTQWKIGANMYPYQVLTNWDTTVKTFIKDCKPDWICFDMYPFGDGGNGMAEYLTNLAWEKALADPSGVPCWAYLQTAYYGNIDLVTEAQLRYQTNAVMAMGADGALCFMATATDVNHGAILDENGIPNDNLYPKCKSVFNDLHAMHGVFLPYDCKQVLFGGEAACVNAINKKVPGFASDAAAWETLTSVEGTKYMIGCMEKDGKTGFYVVNTNFASSENNVITLHFDGTHTYQLWNRTGLDSMGELDSITLDLIPGDGCFVALDVSNDATTYPEPEKPAEVVIPEVTEVGKDTTFLDLGFNEDGTVYNKVEGGLGLKDFCTCTYGTEDGKPVMSEYDVWTDDAHNAVTNGITVEMYLKLTDKANRAWVIFFRDLSGNGNLNRVCDHGNKADEIHYYHGSYDDNDVMLKGDAEQYLPTGEWLHIVSVVSDAGQYVYVNGKLLSEGHFPNPAPEFSTFVVAESKGVCLLNTMRMYAGVKTADEVQEMYNQFK